jgi:hypothetical protein
MEIRDGLSRLDHLVYATPDLDASLEDLTARVGVAPVAGGSHPGRGTRNALLRLGPSSYLEIIAIDPDQPAPAAPRAFRIDTLREPRLVAWAATTENVSLAVEAAARRGIVIGAPAAGSRRRPDGVELAWRFSDPAVLAGDGLAPFLIDWGQSPHPAASLPDGAVLVGLRAEHPQPDAIRTMLQQLGLALPVSAAPAPALVATIRGLKGLIDLR